MEVWALERAKTGPGEARALAMENRDYSTVEYALAAKSLEFSASKFLGALDFGRTF